MTQPSRSTLIGARDVTIPTVNAATVPVLTAAQMRRVDELVIDEIGVDLVRMMENAGQHLAELAITVFDPASVTVLVGGGNNGGGGLVAARHLSNRGVSVTVAMTTDAPRGGIVETQLRAALACGAVVVAAPANADLIIDALVGYGLDGTLRGRTAELASWVRDQAAPVLALDAPSGLDTTTGAAGPGAVTATATLTLALPKAGLIGAPEVGELYVADISVPRRVYAELGIEVPPLFARGPVVRLLRPGDEQVPEVTTDSVLAWHSPLDAVRLIVTGKTFATASLIALVVGTLLTAVNLGGALIGGHAGLATAFQAVANYLIPYVVSSLGVLSRTRVRLEEHPT